MDAVGGEFFYRYARHWKLRLPVSNTYLVRNAIPPAFSHMTVDGITVAHVGNCSRPRLRGVMSTTTPCRSCP